MPRITGIAALAALASAVLCAPASAASLHQIGAFNRPIFVTSDPSDPERLLVVEREGRVQETGPAGARTFADLESLVSCCEGERGLLSIAPAPDFHASGRFYADYTGTPSAGGQEGDIHVDSFRPDPGNPGGLIREPLLTIGHSQYSNHNGGQLELGPDGDLYVSVGDGGGGGDPLGSGQSGETLLGKILRIDPRPGGAPAYAIPAGNPFVAGPGLDEIWAYGLRNPWRFSFDYATGDMVIADVGQEMREEVDFAPNGGGVPSNGGANYGWSCREGFIAYPSALGSCTGRSGFSDPVFDYPHEDPGGGAAHGCSIVGGYVVRDQSVAGLLGRYVYSDFCAGAIRSFVLPASASGRASGDRSEGLQVDAPTSFGEDSCGRVYVTSNAGPVYRLEGAAPAVCPQSAAAVPISQRVSKEVRVLLRAKRSLRPVRLIASVIPCAGHAGASLRLERGGRKFAVKRLGRHCRARFRARVRRRATFRAVLPGSVPTRSRRVRVGALRGTRVATAQRSQVRTIALAKPMP